MRMKCTLVVAGAVGLLLTGCSHDRKPHGDVPAYVHEGMANYICDTLDSAPNSQGYQSSIGHARSGIYTYNDAKAIVDGSIKGYCPEHSGLIS